MVSRPAAISSELPWVPLPMVLLAASAEFLQKNQLTAIMFPGRIRGVRAGKRAARRGRQIIHDQYNIMQFNIYTDNAIQYI
jgi:hypothetical protein